MNTITDTNTGPANVAPYFQPVITRDGAYGVALRSAADLRIFAQAHFVRWDSDVVRALGEDLDILQSLLGGRALHFVCPAHLVEGNVARGIESLGFAPAGSTPDQLGRDCLMWVRQQTRNGEAS